MYHLLIVDDENLAVRGVKASIDWEKLSISSVHVAYNIRQAKDIFNSHPIDLMICDIEMPRGSGIELLEWVREHRSRMEVIFLTCHAEFVYAQKAMELGTFDYLLKPINGERLAGVLQNVLTKIRKDNEIEAMETDIRQYNQLRASFQSRLKEEFWTDLFRQAIPSSGGRLQEYIDNHDLPFTESTPFLPVMIHIQDWHKEINQRDERLLEYALKNAADELIARNSPLGAVFMFDSRRLMAIIPAQARAESRRVEADCEVFIAACNQYFFCDVCCYIGSPALPRDMVEILRSLSELERNNVARINEVFHLQAQRSSRKQLEPPELGKWLEMIKAGAKEKLKLEIGRYLERIKDEATAHWMNEFYHNVLQMTFFVLHVKGVQAHTVFAEGLMTENPERALQSMQRLKEWVLYLMDITINQLHAEQENRTIVDKVKQYIEEIIGLQSLTREDIANHVYLNPDYLTRLFRKEVGINLSDYLQQQRIEFARSLLETTDKSIGEIALTAGYSNIAYFSRIFKQVTAMKPLEYRKSVKTK